MRDWLCAAASPAPAARPSVAARARPARRRQAVWQWTRGIDNGPRGFDSSSAMRKPCQVRAALAGEKRADFRGGACAPRRAVRPPRQKRLPEMGKRSEEHTSELQSLMRISYAVFCLKNKTIQNITK